jgi:organic radical activating enzyme
MTEKIIEQKTSLMLFVTLGCNIKCAHCCLECSIDKANQKLSFAEIEYCIEKAHKNKIEHVVLTGGEPMLYPEEVAQATKLAGKLGMYVDLRTNGFWAKNELSTRTFLAKMKSLGLCQIGLSFDNYHRHIPLENIRLITELSKELELSCYVDWTGGETREQVLEFLEIDYSLLRYVGKPLRVGRAKELDQEHFENCNLTELRTWASETGLCNCNEMLWVVMPGNLASYSPCCWVNPSLAKVVSNYDDVLNIKNIIDWQELADFAEKQEMTKNNYSHPCELCYEILPLLANRRN